MTFTMVNTPGTPIGGLPPDPDLAEAFRRLFGGPDWDSFEKVAFKYFDANPTNFDAHRKFFEHFTPQWKQLCNDRKYSHAEALWNKAIAITHKWEKVKGGHIHKGTPFYFWGGTALLNGEIDLGFVLIHEALQEDKWAESFGGKPSDTLPAWCFVILKDEVQEQYWRLLVKDMATFLDHCLSTYNKHCGGSLALSDFKSRFLQKAQYREATFFFAYSLWKFKRHLDTSQNLTNSSFSILVQLDCVLNLYVVLEELLKVYYGNQKTLYPLVEQFSITHKLGIHQCPPGEKRKRLELMQERFRDNPNSVIQDVLSGSIPDYTPTEIALSSAPSLRNAAAHSIRSYTSLQGQASRLLQTALNAIFVVIDRGP